MYLESVNCPKDIKNIPINELQVLADEVRNAIINRVSKRGGHQGPNLGVVELTIALHYVFDSPNDKIVFDVSHQCYPHKVLTGRKLGYLDENHFGDVTGYTNPKESEHDFFTVGHTSTSISLALGLAEGRDLNKRKENIIAFIGDGSLSGGEALEALDYAGEYDKNLIIVVNDNDQSIAENHGGIYKNLKELRENNGMSSNNMFKSFGLDYIYIEEGHDIPTMVEVFKKVKDIDHPIVVHVHTIKGKGLKFAEENREAFHAGGPFDVKTGKKLFDDDSDNLIHDSLLNLIKRNEKAVILNAGTPMGLGFKGEEKLNLIREGRFIDVGIAEENAMAMSSGIAKAGGVPVFGTYAAFLQRTYDQLSHDLCLNNNPATILVLLPGCDGMTSNTHIAMCDIQFFAHVPNLVYLAPSNKEEYLAMLNYATTQRNHPTAIRMMPSFESCGKEDKTDYSKLNKSKIVEDGEDVALIAFGILLPMAKEVARRYFEKTGKHITVINPVYLTGLDEELLTLLEKNHKHIITIEDGEVDGGYGQRIASFFGEKEMKVTNLGISKAFHTDYEPMKLLEEHGISVEKLLKLI